MIRNGSLLSCYVECCFRRLLATQAKLNEQRALDVAVIGAPNVGKSLLTNQIVRAAVSAVSSKMDTTTHNVDCIITEDSVQLCVVDSPGTIGLGHAKKRMKRTTSDRILSDPEVALARAQHILVVQDPTMTGDYIHHRVMHLLHRHTHLTSSLVINKIDLITDRTQLLELTRILTNDRVGDEPIKTTASIIGRLGPATKEMKLHSMDQISEDPNWQKKYREIMSVPTSKVPYMDTKRMFANIRGWSHFDSVFFVSSLTGEGIDPLRAHLKGLSESRPWRNDEMSVTTKNPHAICLESVRAALLDTTPSDVAYTMKPKIVEWDERGEVLQIVVDLPVEKERIGRLLVGPGGRRISSIGRRVNDHLHSLFQRQLFVRIIVKYKNNPVEVPA